MKLSNILLFAAAAEAQIAVYTSIATALDIQVKSLNNVVRAASSSIFAQASIVLNSINAGITAANAAAPITDLGNALTLLSYYTPLASDIQTLGSNLVGLKLSASSILIRERAAANQLITTVTNKLVSAASNGRPIAQTSVVNPITSALNSAVTAYA